MMYVVYFAEYGAYDPNKEYGRFDNAADAWERAFALTEEEDLEYSDEEYTVVEIKE